MSAPNITPIDGQAIPFKAGKDWPAPDMTLLRPERPPAPSMSPDDFSFVFGPWAEWLNTAATVKGTPVDYVALALLATASACIGNARWASPWEGWKEPPVLWAMLIGDPSAGKSPALDAVLDPVKQLERALSEEYSAARGEWNAADELAALSRIEWKAKAKKAIAQGEEPPAKPEDADAGAPPIRERISISDATTEKVAELVAASWRGLLMQRDELSGWLGGMDRYNAGGDRPFWLEAYGGRSFSVDRKSNPEPVIVDRLAVAVLGGTQPDKLESLLVKTDDDGLLARFVTVFPDPVPLSRPQGRIDEAGLQAALERLRGLSPAYDEHHAPRPFFIPFTDEAADDLQEFREQCREWEKGASGLFKSHIGKLPGMAVRVACVLAHLDWAAHPGSAFPDLITPPHIGRACHLVGEHLRAHAFRAYGTDTAPQEIRNARRIARIIQQEKPRRLNIRDIAHRELAGLQKAKDVETALGILEQGDWLRRETEATPGRPRVFYIVNPNLWGQS